MKIIIEKFKKNIKKIIPALIIIITFFILYLPNAFGIVVNTIDVVINKSFSVTTEAVTNINFASVTLNGSTTASTATINALDGYYPIFKYSTKQATSCLILNNSKEELGSKIVSSDFSKPFSANITGLLSGTTYYYCAYLKDVRTDDQEGIYYNDTTLNKYGEIKSFTTNNPVVTGNNVEWTSNTEDVSEAYLYGSVYYPGVNISPYSFIFKYSTSDGTCQNLNQTSENAGLTAQAASDSKNYVVQIYNLKSNTPYYYCAYLKHPTDQSLNKYGEVKSFTTDLYNPSETAVTTISATYVSTIPATLLAGKFTSKTLTRDDIAPYLNFRYSTSNLACDKLGTQQYRYYAGSTDFGTYLQNLIPGTTYYYCAYLKLPSMDAPLMGAVKTFIANDIPVSKQSLTITTADCSLSGVDYSLKGSFLNDSQKPFTTYFLYKAEDADFTHDGQKTTEYARTENTTRSGSFEANPVLNLNTNYYYQAVGYYNATPDNIFYGNILNCDTNLGDSSNPDYKGQISYTDINSDPVIFTVSNLDPNTPYIFSTGDTAGNQIIDGGNVVYVQVPFTTNGDGTFTSPVQLDSNVTYNFSVKQYDPVTNDYTKKVAVTPIPVKIPSKGPTPPPESVHTKSVNLVPCGTERYAAGTYLIYDKDANDPRSYTADKTTDGKPNIDVSGQIKKENMCTFNYLLQLINNFINFTFKNLVVPIAAIAFAYAGFLLISSGGETSKREKAKKIFLAVVWGLVICAAAWLIVHVILVITGFTAAGGNAFGL